MTQPPIDAVHWQRRMATLAAQHQVPGATLGILRLNDGRADELVEAAHGVLNKNTGVAATADSLFQIGSITKVWTATLAMQLVDEGILNLDAPIVDVLPDLRLSDPEVTKRVTARHLLNHTNGIDGDVFTDTGRGDDCVAKYVAALDTVDQIHPLGAVFSYSNAGYALLGGVIERLTGQTWDSALRERLIEPLGLTHTVTLPEEAILHRAAIGHLSHAGEAPVPTKIWLLPRGAGPSGIITSTAADVLAFARLHLTGGVAPDGQRLLSAAGTAAMAAHSVDVHWPNTVGLSRGLGWIRFDWAGHPLIGHDGATIGQTAFLRLLPDAGLAVALLTNGGQSSLVFEELFREIFADLAGVEMPPSLAPPATPVTVDHRRHLGRYERASQRFEVFERDGDLGVRAIPTGPLVELLDSADVDEYRLVPLDAGGDRYAFQQPWSPTWHGAYFGTLPNGTAYLHTGRLSPKVE